MRECQRIVKANEVTEVTTLRRYTNLFIIIIIISSQERPQQRALTASVWLCRCIIRVLERCQVTVTDNSTAVQLQWSLRTLPLLILPRIHVSLLMVCTVCGTPTVTVLRDSYDVER